MFQTLKNAWKIMDLRKKLLFTLLIVLLYRLGAQIPVPYISQAVFEGAAAQFTGILEYMDFLAGGALSQATLFALSVNPYITASIVIQLLTIAIPALERLSKEGEEGRKKINAITRYVTIGLALVTSYGYMKLLNSNRQELDVRPQPEKPVRVTAESFAPQPEPKKAEPKKAEPKPAAKPAATCRASIKPSLTPTVSEDFGCKAG